MPTPTFIKNFKSLQTLDEVKGALDAAFNQIFDMLQSNPNLQSLLNEKEGVPPTKAGDLIVDYRGGNLSMNMSDGKGLVQLSLSAFGGALSVDQHGPQPGVNLAEDNSVIFALHANATPLFSGFMSGPDKTKLDGLSETSIPYSNVPAIICDASSGSAGVSTLVSRADHTHQIAVGTPVAIGAANNIGTSDNLSRADHVHAHGNQAGGSLHAVAISGGAAGFMSGADKQKVTTMVLVEAFQSVAGNRYLLATVGGTPTYFGPGVTTTPS